MRLSPGSEVPRGRPAVPGASGPVPRACGFDRLSWGTRARVRGPEWSTGFPVGLGPLPVCPRCGPALLGHTRLCPKPSGSTSCPGRQPARLRVPAGSTSCPGPLVLWSEGHRVDMVFRATRTVPEGPAIEPLSRAIRAFVRGPLGSTSGPGNTGLCARARGVDHLFRAPQDGTQGPTMSTNSPGHLGFWSRVPR